MYEAVAEYLLQHLPAMARLGGVLAVAPFFSSFFIPGLPRVLLITALAVSLGGLIPPLPAAALATPGTYLGAVLGEALLGLALGMGAQLLLQALVFAGQILDLQIGLSAGVFYDPTAGEQVTQLGRVYSMIGTVLFLEMGGHHWLLHGVMGSFGPLTAGSLAASPSLWQVGVGLGESIFRLAMLAAAPALLALFLLDVAFGVIARAAPQMNVFLVEMPAKIGVGLVALFLCAPLLLGLMSSLIADMDRYLRALVAAGGG